MRIRNPDFYRPAVSDRARSQGAERRRGVGSRRTSAGRRGGRWCREGRQHRCQVRHCSAAAAGCRQQGCARHHRSPGCWKDLGWALGWQAGYGNNTRVREDASHITVCESHNAVPSIYGKYQGGHERTGSQPMSKNVHSPNIHFLMTCSHLSAENADWNDKRKGRLHFKKFKKSGSCNSRMGVWIRK